MRLPCILDQKRCFYSCPCIACRIGSEALNGEFGLGQLFISSGGENNASNTEGALEISLC